MLSAVRLALRYDSERRLSGLHHKERWLSFGASLALGVEGLGGALSTWRFRWRWRARPRAGETYVLESQAFRNSHGGGLGAGRLVSRRLRGNAGEPR